MVKFSIDLSPFDKVGCSKSSEYCLKHLAETFWITSCPFTIIRVNEFNMTLTSGGKSSMDLVRFWSSSFREAESDSVTSASHFGRLLIGATFWINKEMHFHWEHRQRFNGQMENCVPLKMHQKELLTMDFKESLSTGTEIFLLRVERCEACSSSISAFEAPSPIRQSIKLLFAMNGVCWAFKFLSFLQNLQQIHPS